jgi:hypothetical protein
VAESLSLNFKIGFASVVRSRYDRWRAACSGLVVAAAAADWNGVGGAGAAAVSGLWRAAGAWGESVHGLLLGGVPGAALASGPTQPGPDRRGEAARNELDLTFKVVKKPPNQVGFKVLPRRWIVERSLSWHMRARRNSRDYERLPEHSEAHITWANITPRPRSGSQSGARSATCEPMSSTRS